MAACLCTMVIASARDQIWTSSTISGARAQYSRNLDMHELSPAFWHHFHAALISHGLLGHFVVACLMHGELSVTEIHCVKTLNLDLEIYDYG